MREKQLELLSLIIYNKDMKSRDYESIKNKFRPGHADFTYYKKYGIRDYRVVEDSQLEKLLLELLLAQLLKKF